MKKLNSSKHGDKALLIQISDHHQSMAPKVTVTSVEFRNFKALEKFSIKLQHLNVLVGPNNSGKSTILSAFRVLAAGLRRARSKNPERIPIDNNLHFGYSLSNEALPISVENVHTDLSETDSFISFRLSNGNKIKISFPREGSALMFPETIGKPVKSTQSFREAFPIDVGLVPVLVPVENKENVLNDETVRRDLATHRASRHFRNFWYHYPEGFEHFSELLARTWPGMEIKKPEKVGPFGDELKMFCTEKRMTRELFWSGFGFQIWCQLLTHITRSRDHTILVVDEPEIYLHPDVQRQLLGILRSAGPDILLATHSAEIMGEADPSEILVIDKTKQSAERLKDFEGVQSALDDLGSIQNITLTQLARNRRILFVEGLEDFKMLRRFAHKLGFIELSSGLDLTPVESGGFSSWEKIPGLAWGIEKALGSSLHLAAVYDRDYFCSEQIDMIKAELKKNLEYAHIHDRKEIENYLLIPTVLERAILRIFEDKEKRSGEKLSLSENVADVLDKITSKFKAEAQSQYIAKRSFFLKNSKSDPATITMETITSFETKWSTLSDRLQIVPGKDTLKDFRTYLQNKYAVSLTDFKIIDSFKPDEIPQDLVLLIKELEVFRTGKGSLIV